MRSNLYILVPATTKIPALRARKKFKPRIGKKYRKMAKRVKAKGHSARNGNCPAPYTKYGKKPYKYTFQGAYTKAGGGPAPSKYPTEKRA